MCGGAGEHSWLNEAGHIGCACAHHSANRKLNSCFAAMVGSYLSAPVEFVQSIWAPSE